MLLIVLLVVSLSQLWCIVAIAILTVQRHVTLRVSVEQLTAIPGIFLRDCLGLQELRGDNVTKMLGRDRIKPASLQLMLFSRDSRAEVMSQFMVLSENWAAQFRCCWVRLCTRKMRISSVLC